MVLREIQSKRATEGDVQRRWFSGRHLDLYVWITSKVDIVKFQICYLSGGEHALTWDAESGYSHQRVDDGESAPLANQSPLLAAETRFSKSTLIAILFGVRRSLDAEIYQFTDAKIAQFDSE